MKITGDVQGVSYRAYCARAARERGVAGTVENAADGSVLAHFEGDDEAVESMLAWCRGGSPAASVSQVRIRDSAPTGETGFSIER